MISLVGYMQSDLELYHKLLENKNISSENINIINYIIHEMLKSKIIPSVKKDNKEQELA